MNLMCPIVIKKKNKTKINTMLHDLSYYATLNTCFPPHAPHFLSYWNLFRTIRSIFLTWAQKLALKNGFESD